MTEILTISDAIYLNQVIDAASQSAKVAWVNDEDAEAGDVRYGTARHIVQGPDDIGFLRNDQDVRNGYLRITSRTGMEVFLPVRDLMRMAAEGRFAIYDW